MLTFLAANWVIFLIVAVVAYLIAGGLQLRNMKMMMTDTNLGLDNLAAKTFGRFAFVFLFGVVGSLSFLAFLIGLVVSIINHVQSTGAA